MGILMWDKPQKVQSTQEWKDAHGFDGGPVGGFVPNMSKNDEERWKAKLTGVKLGFPQVEIRKSTAGAQMTIIVNLGKGYNYKHYLAISKTYGGKTPADFRYPMTQDEIDRYAARDSTAGINVHVALNGAAQMSFQDIEDMHLAISEAKAALEAL
jgi:hypothetical protein